MSTILIPTDTNIELEAQILDPPSSKGPARALARLGGSLNDHVVQTLSQYFTQSRSLRSIAFNSRGVGKSKGNSSWSGNSESKDFQKIIEFSIESFSKDYPNSRGCQIYICGYSAGSLYASTTKISKKFLKNFQGFNNNNKDGFSSGRPRYFLISLPVSWIWALSFFKSSVYQDALKGLLMASGRVNGDSGDKRIRIDDTLEEGSSSSSSYKEISKEDDEIDADEDLAIDLLIAFGLQDQLTKGDTYESWLTSLRSITPYSSTNKPFNSNSNSDSDSLPTSKGHFNQSTLEEVRIDGADHFWSKPGCLPKLINSLNRWIERLDELEREGR